jgi:hypothetical protein
VSEAAALAGMDRRHFYRLANDLGVNIKRGGGE